MDTNIDYNALLADAQAQHTLLKEVQAQIAAERYSLAFHGAVVGDHRLIDLDRQHDAAQTKYTTWINENITKRGITLHADQFTGKPIGLSIVIAGRR